MQLFYHPDLKQDTTHHTLNREESKHIFKVLRKNIGDNISITDGKGNHYIGTINHITSNRCDLDIAFAKAHPPQPYQLHIAIAPTKMNDRLEWFLEKATEIGITRITPILCDHSERKKINRERLDRIIVSAMKQSLQFHKPQLDDLIGFQDFLKLETDHLKYIAHCEDDTKTLLYEQAHKGKDSIVLIGPEGDFSKNEISAALTLGYQPVSLGNNRLRTETAGIYTATTFSIINQ